MRSFKSYLLSLDQFFLLLGPENGLQHLTEAGGQVGRKRRPSWLPRLHQWLHHPGLLHGPPQAYLQSVRWSDCIGKSLILILISGKCYGWAVKSTEFKLWCFWSAECGFKSPAVTLVSLSKTLYHCFVLQMGRKAVGPVGCVTLRLGVPGCGCWMYR